MKIRVENITEVHEYPHLRNILKEWVPELKVFGILLREEGIKDTMFGRREELGDNCFLNEEKQVMYKPHVDIHLNNKRCRTKFFETEQEMKDFVTELTAKKEGWIDV